MLLKQQKVSAGDSFDFSSLTLEESSPVEDVVTNTSSTKVSLNASFQHLCCVCLVMGSI